jgi:hypothetical protein
MVTSDTRKVRSRPQSVLLNMNCIHVTVELMQNLHILNTSYNQHFLHGPVSVHYREVLLYFVFLSNTFIMIYSYIYTGHSIYFETICIQLFFDIN